MSFLNDLSGKRVLLTGASTGIGAAVAKGFGDCGAHVAVNYNSSRAAAETVVEAIRTTGGTAVALQADVVDSAAVDGLIDATRQALGGLDVLVNNAGALVRRAPSQEVTDDLFSRIIDLNSRSVVMACKAVLPHFVEQGHGVIINTGSIAVRHGGGPGAGIYAGAKAFIHTYTKTLAKEYAPRGIRVNCVSPGAILTPFHAETPQSAMDGWVQAIPMGRLGEPEDLVGTYLFLASDRMSGYVTGQTIDVNGGFLMLG